MNFKPYPNLSVNIISSTFPVKKVPRIFEPWNAPRVECDWGWPLNTPSLWSQWNVEIPYSAPWFRWTGLFSMNGGWDYLWQWSLEASMSEIEMNINRTSTTSMLRCWARGMRDTSCRAIHTQLAWCGLSLCQPCDCRWRTISASKEIGYHNKIRININKHQ